jgi:CRISPR/Cas system-associated protein Csm6
MLQRDIAKHLAVLAPEEQKRVLEFARSLADSKRQGISGKALAKFAAMLDAAESELITRAIEEGCERVEKDAW